jgi:hypothetical protein
MAKEMEVEHLLLMLLGAYLVYHFFLRRCPICGKIGCSNECGKCGIEGFTPLDVIHTSLDESINNPSCCISNTAGYSIDPIAINGSAPGYATNSAYASPCN